LRNRVDVRLVTDETKLKKLVSKPNCKDFDIINPDLAVVHMGRKRLYQNKPIYVGFSILELSKVHMYKFHYNVIMARYGSANARLLFTDTDSFCYHITTDDVYADMEADQEHYDTSSYPTDHRLYSPRNAKVLGRFKDETHSVPPREFCGLRAKMYSLLVHPDDSPKITAKGIKKCFVKTKLRHEMFREVLQTKQSTTAKFQLFKSKNQTVYTCDITKTCLTAFDDKRYLLDDGVTSYAYGHYKINCDLLPSKRPRLV